jgi:hypothetical protein
MAKYARAGMFVVLLCLEPASLPKSPRAALEPWQM